MLNGAATETVASSGICRRPMATNTPVITKADANRMMQRRAERSAIASAMPIAEAAAPAKANPVWG